MPPKKKPEKKKGGEDEPAGYNVDVMSLDQLKQYARLLENEIEDMRAFCNFYQKTENELVELLRIAEDDLKHEDDVSLLKDVELEKLKLNFFKHLREKRQMPKYMEHTSSEKKEKLSSRISSRLEEEQNRHISETKKLKSILLERNRQLEALQVKIEMGRREAKEKTEDYLREMDTSQKNVFEQAGGRFSETKEDAEKEFKRALEVINLEAKEGKIRGERKLYEACVEFKRKLHNYYKETTRQDLEAIKRLKSKIEKIEESIKNSKSLLEEAKKENKEWKQKAIFKTEYNKKFDIVSKFNACPLRLTKALKIHEKTEKLALENENLLKQIKSVTEQITNLRRHFTTALGRIRNGAEMKAAFLDKKLCFILEEERNKTAASNASPTGSSGIETP